jgi:murein DD-endopeptidase MepM/ murein hydrolase activator NlpD
VGGQVTQAFGCSVYYSGIPGPDCPPAAPWFHDGLDIAAPVGRPVQAAMAGTVIFAGPDGDGPACGAYQGYGLAVVVDNGQGYQTLYAHLSRLEVVVGQVVTPETIIGTVGETGCTSGPHLHFGLRYQDQLVDPAGYIPNKEAKESQ